MAVRTFSRYERKYLLTDDQKRAFLAALGKRFAYDGHSGEDSCYRVHNVYYDTEDNDVVRTSIDRPSYKEKLRLRSYVIPVGPDDRVFLEIKKKSLGRVNKRRVAMTYRDAIAFVERGAAPAAGDYLDGQVLREIGWFVAHRPVRPNYYIGYDRIALECKSDPSIRVTFDRNVRVRTEAVDLEGDAGEELLPPGTWLLEIKTADNYPLWLARELSELKAYSRSFSKYGAAYAARRNGDIDHVQ
ncbi:MAG: polyphosphate polymerase domain-containing protein [Candidatus Izemoplasmatales bacterium]